MNPSTLRLQLSNLSSAAGGHHKEQADRYRSILEQIFQLPQNDGSQNELLQQFIEARE